MSSKSEFSPKLQKVVSDNNYPVYGFKGVIIPLIAVYKRLFPQLSRLQILRAFRDALKWKMGFLEALEFKRLRKENPMSIVVKDQYLPDNDSDVETDFMEDIGLFGERVDINNKRAQEAPPVINFEPAKYEPNNEILKDLRLPEKFIPAHCVHYLDILKREIELEKELEILDDNIDLTSKASSYYARIGWDEDIPINFGPMNDLTRCGDVEPNPGPKNVRRRGRRGKRNNNRRPNNRSFVPRPMTSALPPVLYNTLTYISGLIGYVPGAAVFGSFDFYLCAYRPDVSGTETTSAIALAELLAFYSGSLVLSVEIDFQFVNEEDFEVVVTSAPSTNALSASIGDVQEALALGERPWGKKTVLSRNSGMNRGFFKTRISMPVLFGSRSNYMGEQNYTALGAARPVNLSYITMALASLTGNNMTNGITFVYTMRLKMKFFNRIYDDITIPDLSGVISPNLSNPRFRTTNLGKLTYDNAGPSVDKPL